MLRLTILITAVISFLHFISPASFSFVQKAPEVLGVSKIEKTVNSSTVKEALLMYCITNQKLPSNLNELYNSELSPKPYLDLDANYSYTPKANCQFDLTSK